MPVPPDLSATPDLARSMASSAPTLLASRRFGRFFRMLRAGLSERAVCQLMRARGVDERVLALGADAPVAAAEELERKASEQLPQVDTRVYETSLRMLLAGVPQGAVEMAIQARSLSTRAYEQTLARLHATLAQHSPPVGVSLMTERDETAAKMARVGVPEGAVQQRSALRASLATTESPWTNLFLTVPSDAEKIAAMKDPTPLRDHGPLRRFFAMLRAGVAVEAVENELERAGLPRELAHWDPSLPVQRLSGLPI